MGLLEKIKRSKKAVSIEVGDETFWFAKLSAKQKDRFDLQWAHYRAKYNSGGEGLRGWVVAFCLANDESGQLTYDSGTAEAATDSFINTAREFMESDAGLIEPLFELAATTNRIIDPRDDDDETDTESAKN